MYRSLKDLPKNYENKPLVNYLKQAILENYVYSLL